MALVGSLRTFGAPAPLTSALGRKIMLSASSIARFPATNHVLLQQLESVIRQLRTLNLNPAPFPATLNPVEFYNLAIDFGVSVYAAKLLQLFESIEHAIENETYLIYAQSGRAVLENVATLRYYSKHVDIVAASEAWKGKSLTDPILRKANDTIDRFLRGNRFAWDAFIEGRFDELTRTPHQDHLAQVNSTTCLQKWFKESPKFEPLYLIFCDLVHPNLGSNLLTMGVRDSKLVAGAVGAHSTSMFIIAPTLAGVLGAFKTVKSGVDDLAALRLYPDAASKIH